jgi:hypothetical protein
MVDAIERAGFRKSLEGVLAGGSESDARSDGSLVDGGSDEYLAALGRRHDACRDVHRRASDVVAAPLDIPDRWSG